MTNLPDVDTYEDASKHLSHVGLTSDVLPDDHQPAVDSSSNNGVSTNYAPNPPTPGNTTEKKHWYALRTTYNREQKAYDYFVAKGITAFLPTIITESTRNDKKTKVISSRIPNIFFAYGTERELSNLVFANGELPFLRFYYKITDLGANRRRIPMIVPDNQIRTLQIICSNKDEDIFTTEEAIDKFSKGQRVRIIEGNFAGAEGIVARYKGQQRVGIVIAGALTAATAYIPTAFIKPLDNT